MSNGDERALRIGEAAKLIGVETYVLRFWETQFPFVRPKQSRSRHRYYTEADVAILKMVKHLLHGEGYTIAGARKLIREKGFGGIKDQPPMADQIATGGRRRRIDAVFAQDHDGCSTNGLHLALCEIREELRALHKLLARV